MIKSSMIDTKKVAEKLAQQEKQKAKEDFDTILNNGVSKDTPYYNTINIDKHC